MKGKDSEIGKASRQLRKEDSKTGKGFRELLRETLLNAADLVGPSEKKLERKLEETNDPLLKKNADDKYEDKLENFDEENANSRVDESKPIREELTINEDYNMLYPGAFNNDLALKEFEKKIKQIKEDPSLIKNLNLPEPKNYSSAPSSPREKKLTALLEEKISQSTPSSPREYKKLAAPSSKNKTTQSEPNSPGLDKEVYITKKQKEGSKTINSSKGSFIYNTREKLEEARIKLEEAKKSLKHKTKYKESRGSTEKDKDAEIREVKHRLKLEKFKAEHKKSLLKTEIKQTKSPSIFESKEAESLKKNKEYKVESKKSKSEIRRPAKNKESDSIEEKKLENHEKLTSKGKAKIGDYGKNEIPIDKTKENNLPKQQIKLDERQPTMDFISLEAAEKAEAALGKVTTPGIYKISLLKEKSTSEFFADYGDDIMGTELSLDPNESAIKSEILLMNEKATFTKDTPSQQPAEVNEPKEEIKYGTEDELNHPTTGLAIVKLMQPAEKFQNSTNEPIEHISLQPMVNARDYRSTSDKETESQTTKVEEHEEKKVLDKELHNKNNNPQLLEEAVTDAVILKPTLVTKQKKFKKEYFPISKSESLSDLIRWKEGINEVLQKMTSQKIELVKVTSDKSATSKQIAAAKEIARLKEEAEFKEMVINESKDVESTTMGSSFETMNGE